MEFYIVNADRDRKEKNTILTTLASKAQIVKNVGKNFIQSNLLCIMNNLHHGFMGVIPMLKGSKSQKMLKL